MDVQSERTKRRPADESLARACELVELYAEKGDPRYGRRARVPGRADAPVSGAVDSDDAGLLTCGTPVNQPCG